MLGNEGTIVFLGPSLPRDAANAIGSFDYRPPAAQGDIAEAALERPQAIALIDGVFGSVPSVWHKEILWAIDRGIAVYGAASLGALRAAELYSLGMVGHGRIFEDFASGRLTDDDEVAVIHAPAELGWVCITDAMVDIRRTLDAARDSQNFGNALVESFVRAAKALPFAVRSFANAFRSLRGTYPDVDGARKLEQWIAANAVSQKREDTIELLQSLAKQDPQQRLHCATVHPQFVPTVHWAKAFGINGEGGMLGASAKLLLDELRLRPDLYASLEDEAAPRVLERLSHQLAQRGLAIRDRGELRRLCRNALDAEIFQLAQDRNIATQFRWRVTFKDALLRNENARTRNRPSVPCLRQAWIRLHLPSLERMGLRRNEPCAAAILLGFDSMEHFDSALILDDEIFRHHVTGGHAMTSTAPKVPRWATWIYMASENDPKSPALDFEAAAQANIEQIQRRMPFKQSEYFIASDRQLGPAFFHLSGSNARPNIEEIANIDDIGKVGRDFSKPDNIAKFISRSHEHKTENADKRMLVLWGHGKGMLFLTNPTDDGKQTTSKGVQDVVGFVGAMIKYGLPSRFDILGLDCCFMANLETLFQMRRLASYIIAGPAQIPVRSWPYDNIAHVLEDEFGVDRPDEAVAQAIAVAARESFVEADELDSPVLVLATEKLETALEELNKLGIYLVDKTNFSDRTSGLLSAIILARRAARGHFNAPDYVELESFLSGLKARVASSPTIPDGDKSDIEKLVRETIDVVRACLVQPAPIRGGTAPRSPTIWFPLQPALYKEARELYESLESSRRVKQGPTPLAGWAMFLRKFHGEPIGVDEVIEPKTSLESVQIGVRGYTQVNVLNMTSQL